MDNEKAAVKRALAQEARFIEEKRQIVASLGGSPVDLLTPSADSRLQRKLRANSFRNPSSLIAQDSDQDSAFQQGCHLPASLPEQATASPAGFDAVVADDEEPLPLDHRAELAQYYVEEPRERSRKKCNKKTYMFVAGAFLALIIGSTIGVVAALLTRRPKSKSAASIAADEGCKLDRVALARCANDILPVPDCARIAYEKLAESYALGKEACDSANKGLAALAVAQANHGDDILDPEMFFALSTLYFALEGVNWRDDSGWLKGTSPCLGSWYGVDCSSSSGLFNLTLDNNRLEGTIPTEIGLLSTLESFSLSKNQVTGSLPSEIGSLAKLAYLSTGWTEIQSSLPSEIGNLKELVSLNLEHCPLTGTLPTEIGKLITLESFALHSNQFSGTLPNEFVALSGLKEIALCNLHGITGSVPSSMFVRSSNLVSVWICLPSIDQSVNLRDILMAPRLEAIAIHDTDCSGLLSTEIGLLSNLVLIEVYNSNLQGTIPSEIGLLTKLSTLNVGGLPNLRGPLPSELGLLHNLETLNVIRTGVTGTIPAEVCALNLREFKVGTCTMDLKACVEFEGVSQIDTCGN